MSGNSSLNCNPQPFSPCHKTHKIGLWPFISTGPIAKSISQVTLVSGIYWCLSRNFYFNIQLQNKKCEKAIFFLSQNLEVPTDSAIRNPWLVFLDWQRISESLFTESWYVDSIYWETTMCPQDSYDVQNVISLFVSQEKKEPEIEENKMAFLKI